MSTGKLPNADNKYIRIGESGPEAIESVHQTADHGRTPDHDSDYEGSCLDRAWIVSGSYNLLLCQ